MIIGIDVDEVCADLLTAWLKLYNDDYSDVLTRGECLQWDMTALVKKECGDAIYSYLAHPKLYDGVRPIPGAMEGVRHLRAAGHTIHFITSCHPGPMADAKFEWLYGYGFFHPIPKDAAHIYYHATDHNKAERIDSLRLDVLIDDRPENLSVAPKGCLKLLFDAPHNMAYNPHSSPNQYRVFNWDGVIEVIGYWKSGGRAAITPRGREALYGALEGALGLTADVPQAADPTVESATSKPTNPKDLLGTNKVPLDLWPTTATAVGSLGMLDGALKYGRDNFRAIGIRPSIYVAAAKRHLDAWMEGEEAADDSTVPHLGHALASIAIIVDAQAAGKMVDDRKVKGGYSALMAKLTPIVAFLRNKHSDKAPKHYVIGDDV